jgi:hypothetical protein
MDRSAVIAYVVITLYVAGVITLMALVQPWSM